MPRTAPSHKESGDQRLKVLVIGPSWAGDMVMAQSLLRVLQGRGADIDLVAPPHILALAHRMPEIRETFPLAIAHGELGLGTRWRLGHALRDRSYDWAIVLPNSWKSAIVPFAARVPRRTGYVGEWRWGLLNDLHPIDPQTLPRMTDHYAALAVSSPMPVLAPPPRLVPQADGARRVLDGIGHAMPTAPVLGLCPGAEYGPAKRWPAAYFAETARYALDRGWEVWLFGSARDSAVAHEIQSQTRDRCLDLTGRTGFDEAVDLIALTTAVISNDSGLMHVAAALDRPLVALFGSSSPAHTPPLSARARVLYLGISCSPCFERACPLGHTRCLVDLAPNRAIAALAKCAPALEEHAR